MRWPPELHDVRASATGKWWFRGDLSVFELWEIALTVVNLEPSQIFCSYMEDDFLVVETNKSVGMAHRQSTTPKRR